MSSRSIQLPEGFQLVLTRKRLRFEISSMPSISTILLAWQHRMRQEQNAKFTRAFKQLEHAYTT